MSSKYFALLTQLGADKLANAAALGTKIEITHMAVGDGGGKLPTPDTQQTKLINEKRRAAINTLSIDPKNTNQIIAEQVIPENEGGWWIREIGLFDKDGILIAVANCAETYKPQLQEGSGRTQTIRMILIVSSADSVTLKVDPSVVLATREYVDDTIQKHANSRHHPDATLKEKGFVILSSVVDSSSETQAATPKAVKAAYDFANAANNNANGRVPVGRQVNGKALNADILLNAGDVGAYNKEESNQRFQLKGNYLTAGYSYSKNESDGRYQPKGNYAPAGNYALKGESYTRGESDGRYQSRGNYQTAGNYQPAGNYAVRGECYTRGESDGRYQRAGTNVSLVSIWKGSEIKGETTVNVSRDIRGLAVYARLNDSGTNKLIGGGVCPQTMSEWYQIGFNNEYTMLKPMSASQVRIVSGWGVIELLVSV